MTHPLPCCRNYSPERQKDHTRYKVGRWRDGAVRLPAPHSTGACPPLRSKRATRPAGSNSTLRPCGDAPVLPLRFPRAPPCDRPSPSPVAAAEKGPSAALHSSWLPVAGTSPPQHPLRRAPCIWTLLISLSVTGKNENGEAAGAYLREDARSRRKARSGARGGPAGTQARCLSRRRVTRLRAPGATPCRRRRRTTEGTPPSPRGLEREVCL